MENTSKALCSSLASEVPDVFNRGNFAPAMSVYQFLPCLNDIAVLLLSTSKGEVLNFFSLGYSLNCSSSSEVSHHPTTLQMLIPPADTRLAAKKGRSSFRGRLLTHTNLVT